MFKKLLSITAAILLLSGAITAQTSVNTADLPASLTLTGSEETFFENAEDEVLFIDFATLKVNLSDLKVTNAAGEIVLQEELWTLPVDSIYELSYGSFVPGTYRLELRSFTGVIEKELTVE